MYTSLLTPVSVYASLNPGNTHAFREAHPECSLPQWNPTSGDLSFRVDSYAVTHWFVSPGSRIVWWSTLSQVHILVPGRVACKMRALGPDDSCFWFGLFSFSSEVLFWFQGLAIERRVDEFGRITFCVRIASWSHFSLVLLILLV